MVCCGWLSPSTWPSSLDLGVVGRLGRASQGGEILNLVQDDGWLVQDVGWLVLDDGEFDWV